jgi:hypothetical protein
MNLLEWFQVIANDFCFYTLQISTSTTTNRYYLLDKNFLLVRQIPDVDFPREYFIYSNKPSNVSCVPKHKHVKRLEIDLGIKLKPYLQTVFVDNMTSPLFRAIKLGILPSSDNIQFVEKEGGISKLLRKFDAETYDENIYWSWVFAFMQKQQQQQQRLSFLTCNSIVAGCIWKGFVRHSAATIYYNDQFMSGEIRALLLLLMARNRPRGSNVFAQFNKDVLRFIIIPMVRFTLPVLYPI